MFGISEIAIILIVVIVLLGARKLPELARNAGKAARILKSEAKAMKTEGDAAEQQPTYQIKQSPPAAPTPTSDTRDQGSGSTRT
ncbi:twin-arginine translocase TatA/TatE family subunit [Streptomyces vilmorinianum]|uniref:twin-arginine translocase TatA/TatE family subunit n=1 Tax=Streptomyces vilmorinianum TaxID=3051092 RepID=UPI0010FBA20C|nr:twin-arginine translocase TatA/TatE family subunit [Streptomyces vilmorinianum]